MPRFPLRTSSILQLLVTKPVKVPPVITSQPRGSRRTRTSLTPIWREVRPVEAGQRTAGYIKRDAETRLCRKSIVQASLPQSLIVGSGIAACHHYIAAREGLLFNTAEDLSKSIQLLRHLQEVGVILQYQTILLQ